MLEARNLCFNYPGKTLLKNVSLQVAEGSITAVIGPSGSGKTTLLRCLALLQPPQSGEIVVDGEVFAYPTPKGSLVQPPWPKLTAVFQQLFLWPHLTLRQNILLPVQCRKVPRQNGDIEALIAAFDLHAFIDRYPNEASLGQRQRVAVARALMLEPRYLLLDEITSALDVEQIAKMLAYLKALRGKNTAMFMITHLLGFAREVADQVIFMDQGEIVESGNPAMLANPQTERLAAFLSVIAAAG